MMQVCLNVGGTRYETRLKTLLKGAEQGSEVLAGICQTLTTQHQNYSVSECVRQWLLKHVSFAAAWVLLTLSTALRNIANMR
jgi:hypothetical protein